MCAPVMFQYRCGCSEYVRFECGGAHRERHRERPAVTTRLDEDCHDCHAAPLLPAGMFRMALSAGGVGDGDGIGSPRAALRELDVNIRAAAPPAVESSSSSAAVSFESSASQSSSISTES